MKTIDQAAVTSTVRPRVEVGQVPAGWAIGQWGVPHRRDSSGAVVEYWFFRLDDGAIVVIEQVFAFNALIVYSDSSDTQMLRSELGLQSLLTVDIRYALGSSEVRSLADACRAVGRSIAEAFVAFENSGADPAAILEAVRTAYEVSQDEVWQVFDKHYRSWAPFELRAGPLRKG